MRIGAFAMVAAAAGLLAACADGGRMYGQSNRGNQGGYSSNTGSSNAREACADEARSKGWKVVGFGDQDRDGDNRVEIETRVQQADGDIRNMTCSYNRNTSTAQLGR